jgi:hypothetical protein
MMKRFGKSEITSACGAFALDSYPPMDLSIKTVLNLILCFLSR